MSSEVQAALITVFGMVGVTALTSWAQYFVTKYVIQSERERSVELVLVESRYRRWEAKFNRLADLLAELIGATDPGRENDRAQWLPLLGKVQLLLRYDHPLEQKLNSALNQLGFALDDSRTDKAILFKVHSDVGERAKALLADYHHSD